MLDELLSPLLLIAVIAILVVAFFLVWAMLDFINSHRRIADSLEELVRKSDLTVERRESEKEWVIEEPSSRKPENAIGAGPNKAQLGESFFKA
ncbi:MAG: hypothetical protein HY694_08000 [Deltaproteobacteria bacterium]|nr:hypothetical protein [Deltaproteobacteria bacterium]